MWWRREKTKCGMEWRREWDSNPSARRYARLRLGTLGARTDIKSVPLGTPRGSNPTGAWLYSQDFFKKFGGESGIRTHDTLSDIPVFKTGAFNRSAISPSIF